jgi:5'-nucleotidase
MPDGSPAFTVSGTPADCANIGCLSLIKDPIDLVVSGINTDINIGYDANYSGTVGAALEAAALGYPALAVSQENSPSVDWELAGQITARAVSLYQGWEIPIGTMVNLNVPAKIIDPTWLWVPLNLVAVREYYVIDMDSEGVRRYQRTRDQPHSTYASGSDVDFLRRGRITLSPLGPVRSERRTLERLQSQTPERQTDEP